MAGAAGAAGFTNDRQHDIFGGDARRRFALHFDFHGFRTTLFQGLGRQHMFHFGSADAEGQRAERAVGGGMGVAAYNGHPRQGHPLFRAHYVNDALVRVIQVVQLNAELFTVLNQLLHLNAGHLAGRVNVFGLRRDVVIHGGEGFTRLAHLAAVGAQAVKGLRGGNFMHQMAVDIQQRGFVLRLIHHVRIKQFFV
ncbi:hypothetical protein SB00610_02828 [Klebsiella quasipneumoniae subsp. similipneumoniae]|nr:hypothetical protein SB00610_02828 [Klebsiella quasipneumoniae subsp. similipneumoniae]